MTARRTNSWFTDGRSSWISRWPWILTIGLLPALRCRSEAFRFAHSVKSCWRSMGRSYQARRGARRPFRNLPPGRCASRRTATGWAPCVRGEHPEMAPAKPALVIWRDLNSSSRGFELFTHSKPALEARSRQTRFSPDHLSPGRLFRAGCLLSGGLRSAPDRLQAQCRAHLDLDVGQHLRVVPQMALGVLTPLANALVLVRVPRTRFLDDVVLGGGVEDRAFLGDALPVDDVELGLAERRRELVLHHLDLGADPHRLGAVRAGVLAADVEPDGGVELEGAAAGRRLGRSKHNSYLLADL